MTPNPDDTIAALASPGGPGGRAVVRLSGDRALAAGLAVFHSAGTVTADRRQLCEGEICLPGLHSPLPAMMLVWPPPRSYTGQLVVELHTLSSPPLIERLMAELLSARARAALPGEFTLRAFLAGKLDLPRAEAVLGVIEAKDPDELRQALTQLAGGLTRPLDGLRDDLLSLLADVEAGLDFVEEDISFVGREDLLNRLAKGMAQITLLQKQLDQRGLDQRPFRVALVGKPNAGKSRLFNALTGSTALVSEVPGTTRDYLTARLELDGQPVELIDTAGNREAGDDIEAQAQALGRGQTARADLLLVCVEAGRKSEPAATPAGIEMLPVATKCDLAPASVGFFATSAVTGQGLSELKAAITARVRARRSAGLAPSLSRCRHHVAACLDDLRKAHQAVLFEDPPEVLALELRLALDHLGEMVGAVYTDDLLDRIFSRFCIGK